MVILTYLDLSLMRVVWLLREILFGNGTLQVRNPDLLQEL